MPAISCERGLAGIRARRYPPSLTATKRQRRRRPSGDRRYRRVHAARAMASSACRLPACGSRSGRELAGLGYGEDVEVALETNASARLPILRDGGYTAAAST